MNEPNWRQMIMFLLETHTQAELAEKVGIDQSKISNIKNKKPYKFYYNEGVALKREYDKAIKSEWEKIKDEQ